MSFRHTRMGRRLVLLIMCGIIVAEKKCDQDQFLNKKGKCRQCGFCPPGEGMNFSVQVRSNEDGDPLACHPCSPCSDGYYNDPAADQYECSRCRLNCRLMNRKEYEPCGGTKSGKCGACLNSLYEDKDNNLDSPCYMKTAARHIEVGFDVTTDKVEYNGEEANAVSDHLKGDQKGHTSSSTWIYVLPAVLAGVIIVVIVIYCLVFKKTKLFRGSVAQVPAQSKNSPTGFSMTNGHHNNGMSNAYHKVSLDDLDVEKDGPAGDCTPHGELQLLQYDSVGPAAMNMTSESNFKETAPQRSYPHIQVKERDNCFNYLASHLHGDEVPEIFRELGLRDQTIFAEINLYQIDSIDYYEAMHRLLVKWVRLKAADARLDILCPILDKAGFKKISQNLLQKVEDLNIQVHKSNQRDSLISIDDRMLECCRSENTFKDTSFEKR